MRPPDEKENPDRAGGAAGAEDKIANENDLQSIAPSAFKQARGEYLLHLRPEPGVDGDRALRAVLKRLLRRHGLRCTRVGRLDGGGR